MNDQTPGHAPITVRRLVVYGPITFAVVGAASGVAMGMLTHYRPLYDRVNLEDSVPLAVNGILLGIVIGCSICTLYAEYAAVRLWIEVIAPALLLGSAWMLVGWVIGDKAARNPPPQMIWGGIAGALVGLCCGILQMRSERRGAQRPPAGAMPDAAEQLLIRAAKLDRAGDWDGATTLYEAVLQEPAYAENHEYARNSIRVIASKRLAGSPQREFN